MFSINPISKNLSKACLLVISLAGFSQLAQAERVRHCNYAFNANVKTLNDFAEVVRDDVLFIGGQAAGRHGGVQANTARERARARITDCLQKWVSLSNNQSSFEIATCTNQNISNLQGFDIETGGKSLREEILENFPGLCSRFNNEEVLVVVENPRLLVTGDNRCPRTLNLPSQHLVRGAFCQGL